METADVDGCGSKLWCWQLWLLQITTNCECRFLWCFSRKRYILEIKHHIIFLLWDHANLLVIFPVFSVGIKSTACNCLLVCCNHQLRHSSSELPRLTIPQPQPTKNANATHYFKSAHHMSLFFFLMFWQILNFIHVSLYFLKIYMNFMLRLTIYFSHRLFF